MTAHLGQIAGREPLDSGDHRVSDSAPAAGNRARVPLPVTLFLISTVIPLILQLGPFRLSSSRLVLLVMILPCMILWLSGRAGPIRKADVCVVLICAWSSLSLFVLHGPTMIQASGMLTIEVLGSYLLGRCFIRKPEHFLGVARLLLALVMILLPFGLYENFTGTDLVLHLFGLIGPVDGEIFMADRLGLDRAQGPFAHPILFGVYCGSILGITWYVICEGQSLVRRLRNAVLVAAAGFTALSSGPLSAIVTQTILIGWDRTLRNVPRRWTIFAALGAFCYVVVDFLSNRTPIPVLISYLAFNPQSAYGRIWIWEWGTKNMFDHPIFGIGLNDWERRASMTESVDMFWILWGMRYGVLVWVLWFAAFFLITIAVGRLKNLDAHIHEYRKGYLVTMGGFFLCGWMVHFWNEVLTLFVFMLASGVWMLDYRAPPAAKNAPEEMRPGNHRRTVL